MKNSIAFASILLLCFFAVACKQGDTNASSSNASTRTIQLPNTPEDVVKTWESQIGQNQFAEAKLISTGKALETVVSLDSTYHIEKIAPSSSKVLSISCRTEGDKSECDCVLEDAVGQLKCVYYLQRQNGQWYLQDASSEPIDSEPVKTVNKKPSNPTK
ncbi:MAG: hypothetical protein JNL70_01530 [Saprospiraceae bacterium]|nr:hypothetical protein [Saprospiraceae bacterium]